MPDSYPTQRYLNYEVRFSYAGKAEVWIGVPDRVFGSTVPGVPLYITGNTTDNTTLQEYQVRPAGGLFLKSDNLDEIRQANVKPIKNACGCIETWDIEEETIEIRGEGKYSYDPVIAEYFKLGSTATANDKRRSYGGLSRKSKVNVLIIRKNYTSINQITNLFECHYYECIILPTNQPKADGNIATIPLVFKPISLKKADGSCESPGKQSIDEWFVRVKGDNTNELLSPNEVKSLLKVP